MSKKNGKGFCNRANKVKYPDQLAAKMSLANISRYGREEKHGKIPIREYKCEFCNRYHLTSQEKKSVDLLETV